MTPSQALVRQLSQRESQEAIRKGAEPNGNCNFV